MIISSFIVPGLLVMTVATEDLDGFQRFMDSAKYNGFDVEVLGMNMKWTGGNMDYAGGGQKVNLLRSAMEKYKDRTDLIVMFVDRLVEYHTVRH